MTDDLLIKAAIAGNREALAKLVDSYKDIAFNIALSIVKDREDAKDIVQESFLRVIMNIARFRNQSAFSTWLYRIVYNESLRHLQKLNKRFVLNADEYKLAFHVEGDDKLFDTRYAAVLDQIDKLPDRDRHLVILFYLGEKSIKEIQEITGMTQANIKVLLYRTRKKISEVLKVQL